MLLRPAAAIYRALYERRKAQFSREPVDVGVPVISVGNITLGGTGKTPCVQWVARELQKNGWRVTIVSRGYGGELSQAGAVVADGKSIILNAQQAGDEPLLHARSLPGVAVVIGIDRVRAARIAVTQCGATIVVLDDGFQFYSLQRNLDIVLLDARRPFNNGHLMPAGRLREPPESLQRAGAIVLTRCAMATAEEIAATRASIKEFSQAPIFQSNHVSVGVRNEDNGQIKPLETLKNRRVVALSALAHNEQFANSLEMCGAHVVAHERRRDHHAWREKEVRSFAVKAKSLGAELLLTTEKDAVKIDAAWSEPLPLYSLVIRLDFGDESVAFTELLKDL